MRGRAGGPQAAVAARGAAGGPRDSRVAQAGGPHQAPRGPLRTPPATGPARGSQRAKQSLPGKFYQLESCVWHDIQIFLFITKIHLVF